MTLLPYAEAYLETYPEKWAVGQRLIDITVTLGCNEGSSGCEVLIADPDGAIASDIIAHISALGGIQDIPRPSAPPATPSTAAGATSPSNVGTPADAAAWEDAIIAECLRQGVTDPNQIAYILATAHLESGNFQYLEEIWGPTADQRGYEGRADLGNNQRGDGYRFRGRGLVQITGRRNYTLYSERLGRDFVNNPDEMAEPGVALYTLVDGMINGRFTGRRLDRYISASQQDFYNARRVVNGIVPEVANSIADRARQYLASGRIQQGQAVGSLSAAAAAPVGSVATPAASELDAYKGRKIYITIGDYQTEFYHQSTETSNDGVTKLTGQGVRWVLNRRKRNRSASGVTLREFADMVARSQGLRLDWQADVDTAYEYVDQTAQTDYQVLLREAKAAGLFVDEANGAIRVRSLRNIVDSGVTLAPGLNLISWSVRDIALGNAEDAPSALQQEAPKTEIDPQTGQVNNTVAEIDPTSSEASTGNAATEPTGTAQPGHAAIASASAARTKRVKGLPSAFTVPLTPEALSFEPLMAVRTTGLAGALSRIWLVDRVKHSLASRTTVLECFSPVEAPDTSPPATASAPTATAPSSQGYVMPITGTVTSRRGWRVHPIRGTRRFHAGEDIGAPTGTPVIASNAGVVKRRNDPDGYGLYIDLQHADGRFTRYAHMSAYTAADGATVQQGQEIGKCGSTGGSTGPHLHFEVHQGGDSQDLSTIGLTFRDGARVVAGTTG